MRKTSVYLDESDSVLLATLAEREGVSQASLIRKALRAYTAARPLDRKFALDGSGRGPGDSVADLDADLLLKGFGE